MARVMDDAARAKLLNSLLDQNIGQPVTRGQPITDDDVEEEDPPEGRPQMPSMPGGAPAPMQGNQMSQGREPMIPVPASLANAGMQALMAQASGGRSLGADGQLAGNLMSDEDMMREMGMSETARNPANKVDPRNLPPVEDPEQVDMIRRGRERMGRNA